MSEFSYLEMHPSEGGKGAMGGEGGSGVAGTESGAASARGEWFYILLSCWCDFGPVTSPIPRWPARHTGGQGRGGVATHTNQEHFCTWKISKSQ